jgi:exonuclease SbcD
MPGSPAMRFVHTSDWHLGRSLYGFSLVEDQARILDQIVAITAESRADALVISGDIYDRAVPPPDAVRLLDETLARVALEFRIRVVLIAGNHDAPERLAFGSRLIASSGVHMVGRLTADPVTVPFDDEHGTVELIALPYTEPPNVREVLGESDLRDHDSAFAARIERARAAHDPAKRSVLVAHVFATGGTASESERPLTVGGTGVVELRHFEGFHYAALGHLHRPQAVGRREIRYSGSPLKYSLSEIDHAKSVSIVEIDAAGECRIELAPLSPRRDLRRIEGTLAEILARGVEGGSRDDYVLAVLDDREPLLDALARIREIYPNCVELDRSAFFARAATDRAAGVDLRRTGEREMFAAFVEQVTGEKLRDAEASAFSDIVDEMARSAREADA